jgi:hypothetical protein
MQKDKVMDKITEKNEKMAVEHAKKTAEFEEKKREAEAAKKRKLLREKKRPKTSVWF